MLGTDFSDNLNASSVDGWFGNLYDTFKSNGFDYITGDGDDIVHAGSENDKISLGVGDDSGFGGGGNDNIIGGDGNDGLHGGDGKDILSGESGSDNIWGDAGDDIILGGDGDDRIEGGDNSYFFASDNDNIAAGNGNDLVEGGAGNDTINGESGNDVLLGEDGNDLVSGGSGDDIVWGGAGNDRLLGDSGNDVLDSARDDGLFDADQLFGGAGSDRFIANDADTIFDLGLDDQGVVFEGISLSGGHMDHADSDAGNAFGARPEDGTYTGTNGETYTYSRATGTLTVSMGGLLGIGASTLEIKNFRNGAGGIQLTVDSDDVQDNTPNTPWPSNPLDYLDFFPFGLGRFFQLFGRRNRRDPRLFRNPPVSPLVIDLNGNGVNVSSLSDSDVYFDMDKDGMAERTAWATNGDGLLALDRNNDGKISDISELFGSPLEDGFDALAALDDNLDGALTASDAVFADLRIWVDANQDGVSQEPELHSLASLGIVSISGTGAAVTDLINGNTVSRRGSVTFADGHNANVDDVWFNVDQVDALAELPSDFALDPLADALPELRGSGNVADLHVAISLDATLRDMVKNTVLNAASATSTSFRSSIEAVLLHWTGADAVTATSRGSYVNAQHLAVIEALYGQKYEQKFGLNAGTDSPGPNASKEIEVLYQEILDQTVTRFGAQVFHSQLALAGRGLIDEASVVSEANVFSRITAFVYDGGSDSVVSTDLQGTIASFAATVSGSDDTSLARVAMFMSIVRGARSDLFGDDSAAFEIAVHDGLAQLQDKALVTYGEAIANGANVLAGTSAAETLDSNDPTNSNYVRRLDGIASVIIGGAGNDTLTGRLGGDTYVFRIGDGQDLIRDLGTYDDQSAPSADYDAIAAGAYQGNAGGTDRLLLPGIARADLTFETSGANLIIRIANHPNDVITIQNYFNVSQVGYIEEIVTSDAVLKLADIPTTYTPSLTTGGPGPNIIMGTPGDDTLDGGTGADTFFFGYGSGQDTIIAASDWATTSDTVRVTAPSDSTLMFRQGNDLIIRLYTTITNPDGSTSRVLTNDKLTVKDQYTNPLFGISVTYGVVDAVRFSSGENYLVTATNGSRTTNTDALVLPYNRDQVQFSRTNLAEGYRRGRDLQVTVNGIDYTTLSGQFLTGGSGVFAVTRPTDFNDDGYGASVVIFADGTIMSRRALAEQTPLVGTAAADELIGSAFGDTINGNDGDDLIKGFDGDDIITGGRGNDILQGDSTENDDQYFAPGQPLTPMTFVRERLSRNLLYTGNDTYIYRRGDGNDTIIDQGQGALDTDTLKLVDLNPDDVTITRVRLATPASNDALAAFGTANQYTTTDLVITVKSTGETIRVWDEFFDDKQGIERIEFADGTVYDRDDLLATIPVVLDERGGSELAAIGVVDGGTQYSYVRGFGSTDTALFGTASGNQTAYSIETVRLKDLNSDSITLSRDGLDLLIHAGPNGPVMRIAGHFSDGSQPTYDQSGNAIVPSLKQIVFANGETWSLAQIAASAGIDGTAGPDGLSGTTGADLLRGFAGDDTLTGGAGDDVLIGGSDNDVLSGGTGNDRFVAATNDGNDAIDGGDGSDAYDASALASPVAIDLTAGTATGSEIGADSLVSIEVAVGGRGDDLLQGSANTDTLIGGSGNDNLHGANGDDLLNGGAGADVLDGGAGVDTITYEQARSGVALSLVAGTGSAGEALGDSFLDVENVIGSNYSDTVYGNGGANHIDLGGGNDTAYAGAGNDLVNGGAGADAIWGEAGSDSLHGDAGNDKLNGGDGDDTLSGGLGNDSLDGGAGSDTYTWTLGDGNDTIVDAADTAGETDTLRVFGVAPADIRVEAHGDTLFLVTRTGEQITIDGQFSPAPTNAGIEKVVFDDGTEWDRAALAANVGVRPNRDPYAIADQGLRASQGVGLAIAPATLLGNDFDPDGDVLVISAVSSGPDATVEFMPDGSIRFTPVAGFTGNTSFSYTVRDPYGAEASATVAVEVIAGSVPLTVQDDTLDPLAEDGTRIISASTLLGNDVGTGGSSLQITSVGSATGGQAELLADGNVRFTTTADFNGQASFEYTVVDGAGSTATATARFPVAPVNDPPLLTQALADQTTPEDTAFDIALDKSRFADVDGDILTFSAMSVDGSALPAWLHFDGSHFTGTPPQDFNGTVGITVVASDGQAQAIANFALMISPVNDGPVLLSALTPIASNEDLALSAALPLGAFGDIDGDALTYSAKLVDGSALPGWLHFDGNAFTGNPPANFNGQFDIVVTASDGVLQADAALRLTITPVNDAPVLAVALANQSVRAGDVLDYAIPSGTFSDIDGDALVLSAVLADGSALPSWLHFDGQRLTGNPPSDLSGSFDVRVTASDGSLTASDVLTLAVLPRNRAPDAVDDSLFVTDQAQQLVIAASDLLANDSDPDGDPLQIVSVQGAAHGSVSITANGDIVYSADGSYVGTDSFTYTLSDGTTVDSASVSVRVDNPFATWSQGTSGDDRIFGNMAAANQIYGLSGNDQLKGGQEDDWLAGGDGDDHLIGLSGNDHFWGGAGNDLLNGNAGLDVAHYFGLRSSYSVVTVSGTVTVVDNAPTADGNDGTDTISSIEQLVFKNGETASVISPIILDLDGKGVKTLTASQSRAAFDLDGDGRRDDTSWIGNTEGFLFLDRDGNGTLSGARELSFIDDLPGARSDLDGLRAFDSNGDGRLSADDAQFASFRVWRDANGNGNVDQGEVLGLAQASVKSLDLTGTAVNASTAFGEVAVVNRGSYERTDGTTMEFVDAALTYFSSSPNRPTHSRLSGRGARFGEFDVANTAGISAELDAAIAALSTSNGSNTIAALNGLSDAEAFLRFSGAQDAASGAIGQGTALTQRNQALPTLEVPADLAMAGESGVAGAASRNGFDATDSARILALLRQDMAGFGPSSAIDRIDWKSGASAGMASLSYF